MTPEQEQKLNEVYEFLLQTRSSKALPRDFETAIRERIFGFGGGGKTVTITYVSGVAQDGATKVITVTTKTLTFVNGALTASS